MRKMKWRVFGGSPTPIVCRVALAVCRRGGGWSSNGAVSHLDAVGTTPGSPGWLVGIGGGGWRMAKKKTMPLLTEPLGRTFRSQRNQNQAGTPPGYPGSGVRRTSNDGMGRKAPKWGRNPTPLSAQGSSRSVFLETPQKRQSKKKAISH